MTTVSKNGGTIYISIFLGNIYYSFDNINKTTITSWPLTIENSNPLNNNILTLFFNNSIEITNSKGGSNIYIIIGSEYITVDGNNQSITLNSISNYPGFIQNGSESDSGYNYINIYK
jgi:hypothetical protein